MAKKKILIVVDWFAPGFLGGGPIQSCLNLSFFLKDHYDIYVLTTDTDFGSSTPYPGIENNCWIRNLDPQINVYYTQKKGLSTKQIRNVILELNPDFVYLNHLFSPYFVVYPLWLLLTGQLRSRVVVCPRGALYESALAVKKFKKTPFLFLFKLLGVPGRILFHATNEREKLAIEKHFPNSKILIADNLPNTNQKTFKSVKKEIGVLKCLFIARIHPIKNLLFLLNVLCKCKSTIILTIVGPIEDESYWMKCKQCIDSFPENITVAFKGAIPNLELPYLFQEHHLYVLPTAGENFGHSIFESFLNGRPVLISDQTPWLGLSEKQIGWDISLDDPQSYVNVIEKAAEWHQEDFDYWSMAAHQYAREFIQNPILKKQYLELFYAS